MRGPWDGWNQRSVICDAAVTTGQTKKCSCPSWRRVVVEVLTADFELVGR